jgi:hypothetical protein
MTQKTSDRHTLLKWLGGFVAVLIVILATAAIFIAAKWKPFLTKKIKEGVYEGSQHLYRLDFDDLHVNVLTGSVTIDSVKLQPDTAVFNSLKKMKRAPVHVYELKMAQLRLTRIGFFTAYREKRINMNAIIFDHASINMVHHKVPLNLDTTKVEKTLYDQISKTLKSVHIRTIKILDADFDYLNGETRERLNSVKHLNVNVTDILIDSLSQHDTTRFYYSKNVDFNLAGYKSLTKNKMYTLKVDSVSGSASRGMVSVKGFQMIPMYPEMAFSRKLAVQKDRYDLKFKSIQIKGLDFARINSDGLVHAKSLTIGPAKVKIFRNKEITPSMVNKKATFPHMALQKLELPVIIDALFLKQVDIAYTEYNPIPEKRGTIHIDNISGKLSNVTNDSLQISKHSHIIAALSTRINNAANLDIDMNFDLKQKNSAFTYAGKIGAFDMRALNPVAVALGLVAIESGKVQQINFNIKGNELGANGNVHMYYKDLKVSLLKEGEDGAPMKKRGLLSFIANTLVIYDSNPVKDKPLRIGEVEYIKQPSSSFFSLLWNGVFSGMRESIGLSGVKSKTPQESHKKVLDKKAERKARRQEKREKRQKERLEESKQNQ